MNRRPGRPSSSTVTLSKPRILAAAKAVLRESGADAVTFRAIADRLQVTPMAITHHTGRRADLMADLVTEIYSPLDAPLTAGTPEDQLRELLLRHARCVQDAPSLALYIFATPALFSGRFEKMFEQLCGLAAQMGLADPDRMSQVLIDYTHGAVLAAAHAPADLTETAWAEFALGLDWLLAREPLS
jgi:AcrR family transcriptional regulator